MLRTALVLVALLLPMTASAQIRLLPGSTLRIDGTSSVNAFTCAAPADVHARVSTDTGGQDVTGRLAMPVAAFDCGHDRINRDFREAMKADEHPDIRFELVDAETVGAGGAGDGAVTLRAEGVLTIAGAARPVALALTAHEETNGTYVARGDKALKMTDFGIEPPTALFGLVKTRDEIVVRFRFVADVDAPLTAH